jgi:cell division protease FtsH
VFGHDHGQPFLGREFSSEPDYSDEIAREIDDEIRRIVEAAHQRARDILSERRGALEDGAAALMEAESLERDELAALVERDARRSRAATPAAPAMAGGADAVWMADTGSRAGRLRGG